MCTKRAQGKGEITQFRDKRAFSENSVSGAPFQLIPGQRGGNRDSPRGTLRYVCALQREKPRFDFKIVIIGFEDFEITLKMFRIGQMLAENSRNHRIRALSAHRMHSWASGGVGEHEFLVRRPLKKMCGGRAPRQRRPFFSFSWSVWHGASATSKDSGDFFDTPACFDSCSCTASLRSFSAHTCTMWIFLHQTER